MSQPTFSCVAGYYPPRNTVQRLWSTYLDCYPIAKCISSWLVVCINNNNNNNNNYLYRCLFICQLIVVDIQTSKQVLQSINQHAIKHYYHYTITITIHQSITNHISCLVVVHVHHCTTYMHICGYIIQFSVVQYTVQVFVCVYDI